MKTKNLFFLTIILIMSMHVKATEIAALLRQTKCEMDPEAEAMIVSDMGESRFVQNVEGGLVVEFTREITFKIFKESGVKYAEMEIPLYHNSNDMEVLEEFNATIYNYNGSVINKANIGKRDLYEQKKDRNIRVMKYALPEAQKGSIITIKYQTISPFYFNFQDWNFQASIPVLKSFYTARMIPFYSYVFILTGTEHFDHFQHREDTYNARSLYGVDFVDVIYEFGMNNIPAFKDIAFISAPEDYIMKIDFQLAEVHHPSGYTKKYMDSWETLITNISKNFDFGKYLKKAGSEAKKILKDFNLEGLDEMEKAEFIIGYVKDNFVWDGYYGKYADKSIRDFMRTKEGNIGNINLFLVAMLDQAGISVSPFILSTRGHGKIFSEYPFDHFFNYVAAFCTIGGHNYQFDATEPNLNFNELPIRCYNDKGLLIEKGTATWLKLNPPINSIIDVKILCEINPNKDSLNIELRNQYKGLDGMLFRKKYKENQDNYLEWITPDHFVAQQIEINNLDSTNRPFGMVLKGSMPLLAMENSLIIDPFMKMGLTENPFKFDERKYHIDMVYPKSRQYYFEIEVPEGVQIDFLPEGKNIELNGLSFNRSVVKRDNKIIISAGYRLKRGVYAKEEYAKLKKFYDDMINHFNEKIVLNIMD